MTLNDPRDLASRFQKLMVLAWFYDGFIPELIKSFPGNIYIEQERIGGLLSTRVRTGPFEIHARGT